MPTKKEKSNLPKRKKLTFQRELDTLNEEIERLTLVLTNNMDNKIENVSVLIEASNKLLKLSYNKEKVLEKLTLLNSIDLEN